MIYYITDVNSPTSVFHPIHGLNFRTVINYGNLVLHCFFNCPRNRNDALHVKTICILFAWEAACLQLSQDGGRAATFLCPLRGMRCCASCSRKSRYHKVFAHWNVSRICFWMLIFAWLFSTVKFMKDSFQEGMQESGVGRTRKAQVTKLCSRPLRSWRFEIIKNMYCSHRK